MKTCKKILSVALAATMLASAVPLVASAYIRGYEEEQIKSGDYSYHLNKDGNAVITRYSGNDAEVSVPDTIDGKKVVEIENAFSGNSDLTSVTIPKTVTEITDGAFDGCTKLKTVKLTSKLRRIGVDAFRRCTELKNITLKDGLQEIGNRAFEYSGITTATIPKSVKSIGKQSFYSCKQLSKFEVTGDDTVIGMQAFHDTPWYNSQADGEVYIDNCLYCFKGTASSDYEIDIRDGVTQIGAGAFGNQTNITKIHLPDSVELIGNYAFVNCYALKKVNFTKNLKTIGKFAFYYCTSFENFTLPESVEKLGYGAFAYCESITKFTLPPTIGKVSGELLCNCKKLKTVKLHSAVKSVGVGAFLGCTALKSLSLCKGIKTIGQSAFFNCTALEKINIPEKLKTIEKETFCCCESLTEIQLPKKLSSIEEFAFTNCTGIAKINIPDSVVKIGEKAFYGMKIKSIKLKNPNMRICTDAFYKCNKLKKVTYPNDIYKVDRNAFRGTPWYKALYKKSGNKVYIGKCLCDIKKPGNSLTVKSGIKGVSLPGFHFKTVILPKSVKYIQPESLAYTASVYHHTTDEDGDDSYYEEEVYVTCGIVHCPKGSYAEKYCKKVSCPYDNKMP